MAGPSGDDVPDMEHRRRLWPVPSARVMRGAPIITPAG